MDARAVDLEEELKKRDLFVTHPEAFSIGEIGIWLSVFDCWQWCAENLEGLIVFEDDAIPAKNFDEQLDYLLREVPSFDFVCLWVPENQRQDYLYDVTYNDEGQPSHHGMRSYQDSLYNYGALRAAKVYNGYGNVATLYSSRGAEFFIDRVREVGIYTPVDCYLYQEAHAGRCEGYGPKPFWATLVEYDWSVPTTVHTTERYA